MKKVRFGYKCHYCKKPFPGQPSIINCKSCCEDCFIEERKKHNPCRRYYGKH